MQTYLLTGIRSLRRTLGYTLINILGLTLGVASCLMIFLIVRYELNYDGFYKLSNRTYRVHLHALDYNPQVSPAVAPALRNYFPELEQVTQVLYKNDIVVRVGDNVYNEDKYAFADEHFPEVFDFVWLEGDARTALKEPGTVVLTERVARKYFGSANAMGRTISLFQPNDYRVTGVIRDLPGNTHVQFNFVASFITIADRFKDYGFYGIPGGSMVYIVLPEHYPVSRIESRMKAFITSNWGKDYAKESTLGVQPIRDIHFDQRYLHLSTYTTTSRQTYYGLAGIAVFIILIACINFVNLATGLAALRAREVGVRKVLGARRVQLVWQFLGETAVLVCFCIGLGLLAASLMIPVVDQWLDIRVGTAELYEPMTLGLLGLLLVIVVLLAGVYPAFVQSSFRPVLSLKGVSKLGGQGQLNLRKGLVVVQFAICQLLIIGTLVVAGQMDYFENQDLGFNKESVVSFRLPDGKSREVMAHALASEPGIAAYSFCSGPPANNVNYMAFHSAVLGMPKDDVTEVKYIDERYTRMFGLQLLAGDTITPKAAGDTLLRAVVNETLLGKLHLSPGDAIGKGFELNGQEVRIVGVVHDFQSESKHQKRRSCVLLYDTTWFFDASVRVYPHAVHQTLADIGRVWSGINSKGLFTYEFLDDRIASLYRQEQKVYTAFRLFSVIAILIGCLGLYGLVAFAAMQRTREVGIRKVLGASVPDIVFLFAREFIVLIGIAFVVAAPVAWLIMHRWLENFAYRIGIGWGLFAVAIAVSFAIAAFTISWESLKAAVVNPVRSLRSE